MSAPTLRPSSARTGALAAALLWSVASTVGGCGRDIEVGFDDELAAGGALALGGAPGGTSGEVGAGAGSGGAAPCAPTPCRGKLYQCGNCEDDDADGASDALDVDCLGPCDDDESGLSTGLAAMTGAPCRRDCYFDGDSGQGNDKCEWSHACDPLSIAPDYPPSGDSRCAFMPGATPSGVDCAARQGQQTQTCLDACLPLVPNGCDCFGCCELPGRSGNFFFVSGTGGEGCDLDSLADPSRCPPCTRVESCFNACDECESCVAAAPANSCGAPGACPAGSRACDAEAPCDFGDYCVTGCCVRAPEPI